MPILASVEPRSRLARPRLSKGGGRRIFPGMCGIAGFIDLSRGRSREENDQLAAAMGDCIRHRGPDAGAQCSNPDAGIWLAHRRLAIVDLTEAGAQPMSTPDGRAHIVYNGEAYNAAELRPEL